jgi:hypothetical protein
VRAEFETERARIKEALIFARCLKDPRDKVIHLRRAMNSVRTLASYERLGYARMQPSPKALAALMEEKLQEVSAELEQDTTAGSRARQTWARQALEEVSGGSGRSGVSPDSDDRQEIRRAGRPELAEDRGTRRAKRQRVAFIVEVERGTPAMTEDLSPQGLCVRTPQLRRAGTRMHLTLHAREGPVTTEGIVRWARDLNPAGLGPAQALMGLEFSTPPPELKMDGLSESLR